MYLAEAKTLIVPTENKKNCTAKKNKFNTSTFNSSLLLIRAYSDFLSFKQRTES